MGFVASAMAGPSPGCFRHQRSSSPLKPQEPMHQCCCRSAGLPAASLWRPAAKPHAPVAALAARWAGRAPMLDRSGVLARSALRGWLGLRWLGLRPAMTRKARRPRGNGPRGNGRGEGDIVGQTPHAPERDGAMGSRAARRTDHYGRRGTAEAAGRKQMEPQMHTALCGKRHKGSSSPRKRDPSGIGPRFRGDDGVVCDACEPSGVCYIVPRLRIAMRSQDPMHL